MCKSSSAVPSVKAANKTIAFSTVVLEGYLFKQKHGKCKAWIKRYFRLYNDELRYYKTKNDRNTLAVISLVHYSLKPDARPIAALHQKQWKANTFALISDDKQKFDWPDYYLQASDVNERQTWIACLQENMSKQSCSVLDKWLSRLHLPPAVTRNNKKPELGSLSHPSFVIERIVPLKSSTSTPALPPYPPLSANSSTFFNDDKDDIPSLYENSSEKSFYSNDKHQRCIRFHRSTETLNTYLTQTTAATTSAADAADASSSSLLGFSKFKRRPSDSLIKSRSIDLTDSGREGLTLRLFNWNNYSSNRLIYKSYSSSMAAGSSLSDSMHAIDQFSSSCHVIVETLEMAQRPDELDGESIRHTFNTMC
ncbi:hypothetical protein BDF20DRAFT_898849 [Mycotypha africana]|uniref:uncharacterized protein n=1 Tax=Mycotypha africana TaxID=64632 RepID=UPI002300C193|nr:uncharacterized protein BDF20DRAFT_898849 [Mycotypha africana]KAI8967718.1 hypothetical protein BDF20DRAFT_898849 [Mycotypha africana]